MVKAFGYLRVSGKGQVDGDGFARQEKAIRDYAASHNIEIVSVFAEKGVSGTIETMDRPAFFDMVEALLANGVKTVIVEKLDRLSRDLMTQEACIKDFEKQGFTLVSTCEPDLMATDPTRILMRQIMGAVAQYDKTMTVLKLRVARNRKKAQGFRVEGMKPLGSRPGEQAAIDRMNALRSEGFAFDRIASIMNAENIPTRKAGGKWHATTIQRTINK